jgi:hypothetical protein
MTAPLRNEWFDHLLSIHSFDEVPVYSLLEKMFQKNYDDYEAVVFVQNLSLIVARLYPEQGPNRAP